MSRIAVIGIIVEEGYKPDEANKILSEYGEYIIGRMGVPHRERKINIISVILDAPNQVISTVAGKIGKIEGVSTKTLYSKEFTEEEG